MSHSKFGIKTFVLTLFLTCLSFNSQADIKIIQDLKNTAGNAVGNYLRMCAEGNCKDGGTDHLQLVLDTDDNEYYLYGKVWLNHHHTVTMSGKVMSLYGGEMKRQPEHTKASINTTQDLGYYEYTFWLHLGRVGNSWEPDYENIYESLENRKNNSNKIELELRAPVRPAKLYRLGSDFASAGFSQFCMLGDVPAAFAYVTLECAALAFNGCCKKPVDLEQIYNLTSNYLKTPNSLD